MVARIIGLGFGAIAGVALLILGFVTIGNLTFISQASTANGTVIKFRSGGRGVYPVISFITADGRSVQFTGPVGSNPPEFEIGQTVKVYYNQDNPVGSAKPDSLLSLWFYAGLAGIFAVIFGVLGLSFYSAFFIRQRRIKWLQQNGQRITGEVANIRLNTNVRNMRKSPNVITVHWVDPKSGQIITFKSDNIWLDPLPFSPGSPINILVDPNNLKRFYVDTSPLI